MMTDEIKELREELAKAIKAERAHFKSDSGCWRFNPDGSRWGDMNCAEYRQWRKTWRELEDTVTQLRQKLGAAIRDFCPEAVLSTDPEVTASPPTAAPTV